MRFNSPYWNKWEKIQMLQRWILVHSYLYYNADDPIVSDEMFDNNCKQLVELQRAHKKSSEKTRFYYVFEDFDGSTGFHLISRLRKRDTELIADEAARARGLKRNPFSGK